MKDWLFLGVAILAEVLATSSLKASEGFTKLYPSLLVIAGYLAAMYCLTLALRSIPVGIAYAIWAGAGIILVALIAIFLYAQKPDLPAIVGMTLIIAGVVVLNVFSKVSTH